MPRAKKEQPTVIETAERVTTWRDYLPPALPPMQLITRAELLTKLAARSEAVSARTLRYWEAEGVLPRAVRQFHEGSIQAVYPFWYDDVVQVVAQHRKEGKPLTEVAATVPSGINLLATFHWAMDQRILPLDTQRFANVVAEAQRITTTVEPVTRAQLIFMGRDGTPIVQFFWIPPGEELSTTPTPNSMVDSTVTDLPLIGTG